MRLAHKTLAAIDAALTADQGAAYRGHLEKLMPLAGDAYSTKVEDFRNHLGASLLGRNCGREIWYSFRWATLKKFDGRMLRLFNRGHLEEPRFIALLLTIGCTVWQVDANGKQFRISGHRGHFGGSLDGVGIGIPDMPQTPMLLEFKTHGDKSFTQLKENGVIAAKWEHFIQMQMYAGHNQLTHALYMATNKNTDELHAEIIDFDLNQFSLSSDRVVRIVESQTEGPPRINNSPSWYKCKICDHKDVCHNKAAPARNCRTCEHSRVVDAGGWVCINKPTTPKPLTPQEQRQGCEFYVPLNALTK